MKTSELINELVDSLRCFGDLPTNIKNISWYCPSENGSFEKVNLNSINDSEVEKDKEDEFEDIEEIDISDRRKDENCYPLTVEIMAKINEIIKNQKKIIEWIESEEKKD